jgi:hypothetical protein
MLQDKLQGTGIFAYKNSTYFYYSEDRPLFLKKSQSSSEEKCIIFVLHSLYTDLKNTCVKYGL